ncbi:MAG: hypothetical protein AAF089_18675 [Bacteroidota bacterium]
MLYLAALAAFGSVVCSRLLIAQVARRRREGSIARHRARALIWAALTGLCWWVLVVGPPFFLVVGIVLNVVWYGFEGAMVLSARSDSDPS